MVEAYKGDGAINAPNDPHAPNAVTAKMSELWGKLKDIQKYKNFDNLEYSTLEDLNHDCSWALNEIKKLLPNEDLTQGQLDELDTLNTNFLIKRMLINNKILDDYYDPYKPVDMDEYVEQITTDINILLYKVKKDGIEDCLADMSEIDGMIKTLQDGDLDIINKADYNTILSAYNEIKTCELEYYEQNHDVLDPNQINKFLNEYDDWMSIINDEIVKPGAYAENIEKLQLQLDMVARYDSFFDEIADDMTSDQTQQLESIENQYADLGNQLADIYNNAVQEMISDGLSMEEVETLQNLAESIHNIFPNAQLNNTIDLVANGWEENSPLFRLPVSFLSDKGKEAYDKLFDANTSTYIGKKDAVNLLGQIIDDIEDILEDLGATGNGHDGFWKGGINDDLKIRHLKRFQKVLKLRKDFLEQQIANMEQYMESRVDFKIGNAQNTQSFR